jgi:hypothetical protein
MTAYTLATAVTHNEYLAVCFMWYRLIQG